MAQMPPMKWLGYTLIALAVLLAAVAALPFLIPLDDYIPRVEKEVSARLKEPVSIKGMTIAALPVPHVTIEGIKVGKVDDLKLEKVVVTPDLFSLLQSIRIISSIEIDALVLTPKAIDMILAWFKSDAARPPQSPPQVRLGRIRLNNAVVRLDQAGFGPFDALVRLNSNGEPEHASITTQDGKLKVLIKPDGARYLIDASAKSWTLPLGPALVFDQLAIKAVASRIDAKLGEVSARLYGGSATGKATIRWHKGIQLDGNLEVSQLELRPVAAMLSPGPPVSGRLSAKPVFSASAASADQIMNALRLEMPFSVHNGALHGVDIHRAATSLIRQGTTGGETRFQQLSGKLVLERGSYQFSQLRIASGALAADGKVGISPKKELSGRINVQVSAVGTSASVPLNVGGTVAAPLLYPTGGTMAGAAAGTVMLGPGLGTSVGAKLGGWAEGLFGGKDDKKPKK